MQRCFFFIFLFWGYFTIPAQATDVLRTELSLWLTENTRYADAIKASAKLEIEVQEKSSTISLQASDLLVTDVRLSEGRLKESYRFEHKGNVLTIYDLSLKAGERITLFFDYYILPDIDQDNRLFLESEDLLVLNPEKLRNGRNSARIVGSFYPAIPADASELLVDISLPADHKSKLPGAMEFQTNNQDGSFSHYWRSDKPVDPEDFFLMAGDFESLQGSTLPAYLAEQERNQIALHANKLRRTLEPVLDYLNFSNQLKDEEMLNIDRIARQGLSGFYLNANDVNSPPYSFQLEQAGFLYYYHFDTIKASRGHLDYYLQICGEDWSQDLLEKYWGNFEQQSSNDQLLTLHLAKQTWFRQNAWASQIDSSMAVRKFWQAMERSREPPVISLDYSFKYKDKAQYINFAQDTNLAQVYKIPLQVLMVRNGDSSYSYHWISSAAGALTFDEPSPPQYVEASFGEYFPGMVMERRPESHYLYQLSNTEDEVEKRRALQVLFKTDNPNLFATILGIAMRDDDREMRAAALNRVDQVNEVGLMKLRSTITDLSEHDPDTANRQLAKAIAEKHYGGK